MGISARSYILMSDLKHSLIRMIEQGGPIDIGRYMSECLCHPLYGYYTRRDPFGVDGDFTTAPEISQMFGEMIGLCLADYWMRAGAPSDFVLLECGPGRGTLMADILRASKAVPGFHDAVHVCLMEVSPALREQQEQALSVYDLPHGVLSCEGLDDVPGTWPVLALGNEFLDALPVRQFVRHQGGWRERVVGVDEAREGLCYGVAQAALDPLSIIPMGVQSVAEGNVYEFSPARLSFVEQLCGVLKERGGAALFLDYGELESKAGSSLHAIRAHEHVDVLAQPGECDLSANVDFEVLAARACELGASLHGMVEQGAFLQTLGIGQRAQALMQNSSGSQREDLEKALHRLTDSDQMGELFKVIGFGYDEDTVFAGFTS